MEKLVYQNIYLLAAEKFKNVLLIHAHLFTSVNFLAAWSDSKTI